jgi:hypothetical protein
MFYAFCAYPTPSLLYGLWGFGSLGGIGLQVQIVTGILLAIAELIAYF